MRSQAERGADFWAMHSGDPFVIPNPWDAGSARVLAGLGFHALATTSSAFAFTLGRVDGRATLDDVVAHIAAISSATDLPVSADLENGHGSQPADAARAIRRAANAGAVGGSIEDYNPAGHLYEIGPAVERVAEAVEAASALGFKFTLTARAENHIRGNPNLADTIARLRAFESAGADVLYAPGLQDLEEIAAVCGALSKPVNVLARPDLNVQDIFGAGAQRVSVGGSLAWAAVRTLVDSAAAIRDTGDLSMLDANSPPEEWFVD